VPTHELRGTRDSLPVPSANGPATAREACGKHIFIAMWMCLQRECGRPRFANDTECLRIARDQQRHASP
jgi:hypothetical protein